MIDLNGFDWESKFFRLQTANCDYLKRLQTRMQISKRSAFVFYKAKNWTLDSSIVKARSHNLALKVLTLMPRSKLYEPINDHQEVIVNCKVQILKITHFYRSRTSLFKLCFFASNTSHLFNIRYFTFSFKILHWKHPSLICSIQ